MPLEEIVKNIDAKVLILALSMVVSNGVSIFLYLRNRRFTFDALLSERLFKIQEISFANPFLEDKKFIDGWDEFCLKHRGNGEVDYNASTTQRYLQYEQYCEMIFNLISDAYEQNKSEKKILEKIAFKDWARTHKSWWKNPMDEHSNQDTYSNSLCEMVDSWVK